MISAEERFSLIGVERRVVFLPFGGQIRFAFGAAETLGVKVDGQRANLKPGQNIFLTRVTSRVLLEKRPLTNATKRYFILYEFSVAKFVPVFISDDETLFSTGQNEFGATGAFRRKRPSTKNIISAL